MINRNAKTRQGQTTRRQRASRASLLGKLFPACLSSAARVAFDRQKMFLEVDEEDVLERSDLHSFKLDFLA